MTEYSKIMQGSFVSTGFAKVINLPFQPDYVTFRNLTIAATPAANSVISGFWQSPPMAQGTASVDIYNAGTVYVTDSVAVNGISTFSAGQMLQFGPAYAHNAITGTDFSISKADPAIVTTTTAHGLSTGQVVIFQNLYQTATTGMNQIADIPFTVTVLSATTFSIRWNTNQPNYTVFNTATNVTVNNIGSFKVVLYPYLYQPGVDYISAITLGATTQIVTTTEHNMVQGQEVAFRIPAAYGTVQLNSLPNSIIPGSPIYGYIQQVIDAFTVIVNINSSVFTAFFTNQTFTSMVGQTFPQMLAVGDVNTGGIFYSGGNLYPSPLINGVPTINGPAIAGAFVNNTSQGFIIGNGTCVTDTTAVLVGVAGNVIAWQAYFHDK